ncbi:MAG: methyltransferase domain-containing protein [Burkholderiales bacterium]
MRSPLRSGALVLALVAAAGAAAVELHENDAGPYVPTPTVIVDAMLELAEIRAGDVVYDLGSGDGRLVIASARRFGARGVGIDLQRRLVEMARDNAKKAGVEDRVRFVEGDLFEADIRDASVVMLYLLPQYVMRLVPRLRAELRPGTRIVSHDYPLVPWRPDRQVEMDVEEKEWIVGTPWTKLYYYVVPARVEGVWELSLPAALGSSLLALALAQEPDLLRGTVRDGAAELPLRGLGVAGERIRFGLTLAGRPIEIEGAVADKTMTGEARSGEARGTWSARYLGPLERK